MEDKNSPPAWHTNFPALFFIEEKVIAPAAYGAPIKKPEPIIRFWFKILFVSIGAKSFCTLVLETGTMPLVSLNNIGAQNILPSMIQSPHYLSKEIRSISETLVIP